jgi:hypothetical protein
MQPFYDTVVALKLPTRIFVDPPGLELLNHEHNVYKKFAHVQSLVKPVLIDMTDPTASPLGAEIREELEAKTGRKVTGGPLGKWGVRHVTKKNAFAEKAR